MPEIVQKLHLCWRFKGGISYSDLTDRPESGELFEWAAAWVMGMTDYEKHQQRRAEIQAQMQAQG